MKTMKKILFCGAFVLLLFQGSGCSSFRDFFSDKSLGGGSSAQSKKKAAKKSEYKSRRYSRDPLDSLLFSDPRKSEDWSKNPNLNDAEKAALRNALNPETDVTRREIDSFYRDAEVKRKKRQDSIFGPSPFRK